MSYTGAVLPFFIMDAGTLQEILGRNIGLLRRRDGLTQAELAEILDISDPHMANIETGVTWVSSQVLSLFSNYFNIEPDAFFIIDKTEFLERTSLNEKSDNLGPYEAVEKLKSFICNYPLSFAGEYAEERNERPERLKIADSDKKK